MATLLTPPRSSSAASHYNHYASPHYSAIDSVRRPFYPSTPARSERRDHEPHTPSGMATPRTPYHGSLHTPPASICTPSSVSASARAAAATFQILASSPATPTPKPIKGPWTPSEDRRLLSLVNELGAEKWVVIASRLGSRTGKQCRERWHNHVNPVLNKAPFSIEEEEAIEQLYAEIGPKWAEIAKKLPGRSMSLFLTLTDKIGDNAVKNYWNTTMQRKYRRSLSAGSNASHSTPQRSSTSPYQSWQRITPHGPARNTSPSRYHPYAHHPRTPPATPDRVKAQLSPQNLPPLHIPHYQPPSVRSPYSSHTPSPGSSNHTSEYVGTKLLPDIHTVFSSPSSVSNNLQLPPLQLGLTRSLSEPGYSSIRTTPASPTPTITEESRTEVQNRMKLDSLLI